MSVSNNPHVKAELDNLERQFGNKSHLDLDDYCALFNIKRRAASVHVRNHEVPYIKMGNRAMFIPVLELALYMAKKKAGQEGRIIVAPKQENEMKNRRGFSKAAHKEQLGWKGEGY